MNDDAVAGGQATAYELVIDRKFAARPEMVFAAWTDPALVAGWFGPQGLHVSELEIDLKVNGAYRIAMLNTDGAPHIVGGVYREIDPPHRLSFTWAWESDGVAGNESLVEIEFEAVEGGTMMHFRHSGFESDNAAIMHTAGWNSSFACLSDFLNDNTAGAADPK